MATDLSFAPMSALAEVNPPTPIGSLHPDTAVSFIAMQDVSDRGEWTVRQVRRAGDVRVGYTTFVEGDVLFAKITPCMENGKGTHARGLLNRIGFGSTEFHVLRTRGDNCARFVYYLSQAPLLRVRAQAFMIGSAGQQRVQPDFFRHFLVPLPSPAEQHRVSVVLDSVNETIGQVERQVIKLQQTRTALLDALMTVGLDGKGKLRDPDASPGAFRKTSVGVIPMSWEPRAVGELFTRRAEPGMRGLPVMAVTMQRGLIARESVERRVESTLRPEGHSLVRRGDLVYNMMRMWQGVLGRANCDCLVSPAYVVLRPRPGIDTEFAMYLFSQPSAIALFKRWSQGVVDDRLRLYFKDLVRIRFAVPKSPDEQAAIAERLRAADLTIASTAGHLEALRDLRSGLMNDLLTGQRRVHPPTWGRHDNRA